MGKIGDVGKGEEKIKSKKRKKEKETGGAVCIIETRIGRRSVPIDRPQAFLV